MHVRILKSVPLLKDLTDKKLEILARYPPLIAPPHLTPSSPHPLPPLVPPFPLFPPLIPPPHLTPNSFICRCLLYLVVCIPIVVLNEIHLCSSVISLSLFYNNNIYIKTIVF